MKRAAAFILTLVMLMSLFPASMVAQAETVTKEGFYMVNWSGAADDFEDYEYAYPMPWLYTSQSWITEDTTEIKVSAYGTTDPKEMAQAMKEDFNSRPDGARYMNLNTLTDTFKACVVDVVDMTRGVTLVKNWLENFLAEYSAIGGKLDGIAVDLEYNRASSFYIEDKQYGSAASDSVQNKNIYNEIVANEVYKTRIRPKLVERGFEFWPEDKIGGDKSEIWSMYRYSGSYYAKDRTIWDQVINELLAEYINEAVLYPMLKYYPDATLSDYHRGDTDSWQKGVSDHGTVVGSTVKAGNTSNYNLYDVRPGVNFYKYTTDKTTGLQKRTVYMVPPSFNDAVYEDTPFGNTLWDVNLHKRLLNATDTGLINTWLAYFNYGEGYSMTPYYSEAVLHVGLMNPKPFLGYIIANEVAKKGENHPDPDVGDYYYNLQVVDELMAELTRVAGSSDRKAIQTPMNWNGSYILTGMYAGGRNIWRITPDTTKVSVEDFKVKDTAPTFSVDGLTITFPQGRIIEDGKISKIGTCGYWVETPADVTPVVTATADRYSDNPSFAETFESYSAGAFTSKTAYPHSYWTVNGSAAIQGSSNKALALSGTTTVTNMYVPQNITAGDDYAKQQAWEVTFTLPSGSYGELTLLDCGEYDTGIKISGGKLYYDQGGSSTELGGVALSAGTYTVRREVDFRTAGAFTSSYSVYDSAGTRLGGVNNVAMTAFTLPVQSISMSTSGASNAVLIDDYKLYPTGVSTVFELFDAKYGAELTNTGAARTEDTAYRLSWMNASSQYKVAYIYNGSTLVEKVEMAPGMDGVATGVVEAGSGNIKLTMKVEDGTAPSRINYDKGDFSWTAAVAENLGLAVGEKIPYTGTGDTTGGNTSGDGTTDGTTDGATDGTTDGTTDAQEPSGTTDGTDSSDPTGTVQPDPEPKPGNKKGLGGGWIALIVIASLVILCGGVLAVFWFVVRPKLTEESPAWLLKLSQLMESVLLRKPAAEAAGAADMADISETRVIPEVPETPEATDSAESSDM